jgi:predicted phosphodiesterase
VRIAVVSDIHSNWHALNAAVDDAQGYGAERFWCLGDVVGYGPQPLRCWQYLAHTLNLPEHSWVAGNHDWGLIGRLESNYFIDLMHQMNGPMGDFAEHAWSVLLGQRDVLRHADDLWQSLERLPLLGSPLAGAYLCHGIFSETPRDALGVYAKWPELAERSLTNLYAMLPHLADTTWGELERSAADGWRKPRLMLVGHTHVACAWQPKDDERNGARWTDHTPRLANETIWFQDLEQRPVFANPGSVGFPRDGKPGQATYMLVDWEDKRVGLTLRRVPYDVDDTIEQMKRMGISSQVIRQLK